MSGTDPRTTLALDGLAAQALEGVMPAVSYRASAPRQVGLDVTGVRRAPADTTEQVDQLLFGERFDVLETRNGWGFGQARRDGYVGWVSLEALSDLGPAPTHRVAALRTFAFTEPSIKAAPRHRLSLNALVALEDEQGRFVRLAGSGWTVRDHLAPLGHWERDAATVAERYLGAPYLWGGRDSLGLDCSALVQQALYACGHACPRDSDQQALLGCGIDRSEVRRGDLVFWRGHVAMMLDGERLIHANAVHMCVAIEPLATAIARIDASTGGGTPTGFRRLERL